MKFLIPLLIVYAVCAEKELAESELLKDPRILDLVKKLVENDSDWSKIEKRLSHTADKEDALKNLAAEENKRKNTECNYEMRNGTIIKTVESRKAGAVFIDTPEVSSQDECVAHCCQTDLCNTAVFKQADKGDNSACYLFDCHTPSVCVYTNHPKFSVFRFPGDSKSAIAVTLTDTNTKEPADQSSEESSSDKTKQPSKHSVALFGHCNQDDDCSVANSTCDKKQCVCMSGYYAQEHVCRKACNRYQFECLNHGNPFASPQCIAIYKKCDSHTDCADGSDEKDCDSDKGSEENVASKITHEKHGKPGHKKPQHHKKQETTEEKEMATESDSSSESVTEESKEKSKDHGRKSQTTTDSIPTKATHRKQKTQHSTTAAVTSSNKVMENKPDVVGSTNDEPEMAKHAGLSFPSTKGAVVALSVGIAITLVLIIFILWRERNFRKRAKKGRRMNAGDADYLINGMYL